MRLTYDLRGCAWHGCAGRGVPNRCAPHQVQAAMRSFASARPAQGQRPGNQPPV